MMGSSATEVERLIQAARLHLAHGELHEAAGRATEAIRLDGKQPAAYLVRAEAHRRLKRPERALADLAVAIRLDPHQPGPYVIRAEILKRRCLLDQAIADATSALLLDPRNAAAYAIRAQCRYAIGDHEGAREDVQEMLLIDPTRPIPELRARQSSAPSPATAADDERFWKQAGGGNREDERALFADGKPVDKTYRSRPAVSDEDAPEALGVASGYKPEVIPGPLPRMRGRAKRPLAPGGGGVVLIVGVTVIAACALWMVFRGASAPETSPKPATPQPSQVAHAGTEAAAPAAAPSLVAERPRFLGNPEGNSEVVVGREFELSSGTASTVPEIANLAEINTKGKDYCPWLSSDGLTIYWVMEPPGAEGEVWTARRKDLGSLFAGKRQIGYGRHIAVSSDGLTMFLVTRRADGRAGESIQVSSRRSIDEPFGRPREVPELRSINRPRNLFLSQDGLSLLFNEGDDSTFRLSMATRWSVRSNWETPRAIPISPQVSFDGLVLCPFLTRDGLTLFCTVQSGGRLRFVALSRQTTSQPFASPVFLSLSGVQQIAGWIPRYVETTHELFFCSAGQSSDGNLDIWVVKNFQAIRSSLEGGIATGRHVKSGETMVPATRPIAAPEIVSLTEINTAKRDFCPWLSPDGLTIYWVTDAPSDPEGEIWTARRKGPGSLFADKRQVGYGRHIAVSADGLTMLLVARRADGRPGTSIQVARRPSTDETFCRPQEIPELRSIESPRNLFLSADGRTLMFCDGPFTTAGFRLMMMTRGSPDARWGQPHPVPAALGRGVQGLMTGPHLSANGRMLLCALEQPSDRPLVRFMACSRNTPDEPFSRPVFLDLPEVNEFFGWMPRYVEATHELFFCSNRLTSAGDLDLWVVRNFDAPRLDQQSP